MTPGKYDAVAKRALATIKRKGSPAIFRGAGIVTEPVYDPLTGLWSDPVNVPGATNSAPAVRIPGNPTRYATNGMTMIDSISLLVAAVPGGPVPAVGMTVEFGDPSKEYTIKWVEPTAPAGKPIMFSIDGQG